MTLLCPPHPTGGHATDTADTLRQAHDLILTAALKEALLHHEHRLTNPGPDSTRPDRHATSTRLDTIATIKALCDGTLDPVHYLAAAVLAETSTTPTVHS